MKTFRKVSVMILTVFPEVEWLLVHTEVPRREPVSVAHGPHCVAITLHGDILNFPGGHGSHRSLGVHLSLVLRKGRTTLVYFSSPTLVSCRVPGTQGDQNTFGG